MPPNFGNVDLLDIFVAIRAKIHHYLTIARLRFGIFDDLQCKAKSALEANVSFPLAIFCLEQETIFCILLRIV